MRKAISLLIVLFVLATAVPTLGAPVIFQPLKDESLPNINIKVAQLSNDITNAENVTLTLVFNNSILDINEGATGKIRIGFSGLSPFNVSEITIDSLDKNGNPIAIAGTEVYQGAMEQYIDIYIQVPIAISDNITVIIKGLKNPETPGDYTVAVSTWIAGSMRSSGATTVTIKGPKPPLNLPEPFLIKWHPSSECSGCSPNVHYGIENKTPVGENDDGTIYEISYPVEYNLTYCGSGEFDFNVYAWNLTYQNLTFKGVKIFVDNQIEAWLPAEDFVKYQECKLISDGEVSNGVITEDFEEKNSNVTGWKISNISNDNDFEHAEPADMVIYFDEPRGWALTTYPTSYEIMNNSYIMTVPLNLTDGESVDVTSYTGDVYVNTVFDSALDENVTVYFQYKVKSGGTWSDWNTIFVLDSTADYGYADWTSTIDVTDATQIQFRFFVNYTIVHEFTKPGFALYKFSVWNDEVTDCDTVYAVNPKDGHNTTLYVYSNPDEVLSGLVDETDHVIELEAIYELTDERQLERYDPIQVASQDFYLNWVESCPISGLCDILSHARYIVEGGGSWTFGSPQPYFGWEFDANQNPVIATGHGSLAADNLGVLFFLSQAGADPNKVIFDDNPQYVNLTNGKMHGLQPGDIVVLIGSSGVNLPLGYYEYITGEAPVVRIPPQNGMFDAFRLPDGTVVEWAGPDEQWYDVSRDIFVIQWFTTENGVLVFSVEGAGVDGTVAGSWLISWLVYNGYGSDPLPPTGYIVGEWRESSDDWVEWEEPIFAPAWIRGSPDDVNGFSTGDDIIKIEYMSDPGLFDLEPGEILLTESIPSCWCYGEGW